MKLFKRIDNYLLHNYPSLWVTRLHIFLPIGLGLVLVIFLSNMAIGWNPKDDFPENEIAILLMVIPVLIYLVYWFIFQSRYNVNKSGGKMSIRNEYLNFISYIVVLFVAYMLILAIPYSNYQKLFLAVDEDELREDIENLNNGHALVNDVGVFEWNNGGTYDVQNEMFIYNYRGYNSYEENETYITTSFYDRVTLSKKEVLYRIEKFKEAYNKYTYYETHDSSEEILWNRIYEDENNITYQYYDDWDIQYKIERLLDIYERNSWIGNGFDKWFWQISFALIAWLALLVWIFKQMNLRHFIFGLISLFLTPLVVVIVGVIIFEIIYMHNTMGEKLGIYLVLIAYAVIGLIAMRGYKADKLNNGAYILTMYFHFFLPILPIFIFIAIIYGSDYRYSYYYYNEELIFDIIYWSCIILGVMSVLLFKPVYTKFRTLPEKK